MLMVQPIQTVRITVSVPGVIPEGDNHHRIMAKVQ